MSGFSFTIAEGGVKRLSQGKEMRDFINRAAEATLAAAQEIAPVETGEYLGSLGVTKAITTEDGGVAATVYSSSWKWHFVEFGTAEHQAHHVLERAVTSTGIPFKANGR